MNNALIGLICFVGALLAGRVINERALTKLDEDNQKKIVEGLSRYRAASLVGVVLVVAGYFIFRGYSDQDGSTVFSIFALVLVIYLLAGTAFVFVKLKKMKIDENYISSFLLSTAVQYLGLITYFGFARA